MLPQLRKFTDKLNEFELGKFGARQIMWRAILFFEGKPFAIYNAMTSNLDAEIFRTVYHLPSLADLMAQRLILTTGVCVAIARRLYGELEKTRFVVYDETDDKWIIFPPDIPKDRYLIFVPPVYLSTDPQQYLLTIHFFPEGESEGFTVEIPPKPLTEGGTEMLERLAGLAFL